MKTAIIILPEFKNNYDHGQYISVSDGKLKSKGFTLMSISDWNQLYSVLLQVSVLSCIPIDVIRSKNGKADVIWTRQIFCKRAKEVTKCSLVLIGAIAGGLDHSTVLHGIKAVNNDCYLSKLYDFYFNNGQCPKRKEKFIINGKYNPLFRKEEKTTVVIDPIKVEVVTPVEKFRSPFAEHPLRPTHHQGYFEHAIK